MADFFLLHFEISFYYHFFSTKFLRHLCTRMGWYRVNLVMKIHSKIEFNELSSQFYFHFKALNSNYSLMCTINYIISSSFSTYVSFDRDKKNFISFSNPFFFFYRFLIKFITCSKFFQVYHVNARSFWSIDILYYQR